MNNNFKQDKFIDSLIKVHHDSNTPFIIFNKDKIILYANKSFLDAFLIINEKEIIGKEINFLFTKEDKKLTSFSSLNLSTILKSEHIFSFFPKDKDETFFYISTFKIQENANLSYYFSIIKEITELEEMLMEESIRALVIASQLKDNDTGNHIKRVNTYSYIISKHLHKTKSNLFPEIDNDFIEKIFKVASLHDVGKIGTPDYILTKPDKLTEDEFKIMREHTINGAFILSRMAGQMARDIALFHHEKWDGTGYPYQLKGNQIPVSARIVALGDVYDALRMKRHYKPSYTHEKTIEIIVENKGLHFDPEIIDTFLLLDKQFKEVFEKMKDSEEMMVFYPDISIQ